MSSNSSCSSGSSNSSSSMMTRAKKRYRKDEEEEDRRSLVLFLLGAVGYECEADRVARVSRRILESEQIVEGISRYQFLGKSRTRLMYAAKVGNVQRLNFIAGLGARVNMIGLGDVGWDEKWTALHFASRHGHTDCVRSLCDRGAGIDARSEDGTALHFACDRGHIDVVRLLCERGAKIDLQIDGYSALTYASLNDHTDIARYLCERGANTLLKSRNFGFTPYMHACCQHGPETPMALLLKAYPH